MRSNANQKALRSGGGKHKMQKALVKLDFSKPLIWDTPEFLDQFYQLVEHPPLHSVVVHIDPVAAKKLLDVANKRNRPLNQGAIANIVAEHEGGHFELDGNTLKFSVSGGLIDGQHRLGACIKAKKGFTTHVVFGLDEKIFDILDRQRTRTPGDILALCNVKSPVIVAGAVRWVLHLTEGRRGVASRGLTPRRIRELAQGPMKAITQYVNTADEISRAYRHPPTMVAALLYLIGQHSKATAESFAQDWLHGNRNYARNKNFDVLVSRIATIRAQSRGHLNRTVQAALLVQCFNHWNAGITAELRAMTWDKKLAFPVLVFDKAEFIAAKSRRQWTSTELSAVQSRVYQALADKANGSAKVAMAYPELAAASNVPERQLPYVMRTLVEARLLYVDKKGVAGAPNTYRLTLADKNAAERIPA